LFGPDDIVVALGQDGVIANTMKYLDGQRLMGVNPDPRRYDGVLLPFTPNDVEMVLPQVIARKRPVKSVTMAQATLSDGQLLYAVNDLFVGPKTHTSARYEIALRYRKETQSSSGIIISTGLGSTAWMRSILTGASMLMQSQSAKLDLPSIGSMAWDAPFLRFAVREPFPSVATQTNLVFGEANKQSPLLVRSLMAENGVIFSDGNRKRLSRVHFRAHGYDFGLGSCWTTGALAVRNGLFTYRVRDDSRVACTTQGCGMSGAGAIG
jgi:hypothetical protein